MQIKPELNLKQTQKLVMTPQLQQAIKMLQLSTIELQNAIEQELMENPALEVDEEKNQNEISLDNAEILKVDDQESSDPEEMGFDDNEYFEEYFIEKNAQIGKSEDTEDTKRKFLEGAVARDETLQEYLVSQLSMMDVDAQLKELATILISYIDPMGYLSLSIDELSKEIGIPEKKLLEALKLVQSLDPPGVGARNIKECLLLQLENLNEDPELLSLSKRIIEESLNDLKLHRVEEIAKRYKVPVSVIERAVEIISRLEPYPGRQFYSGDINYIIPDVIVEKREGNWEVITNDIAIPRLRVNRYYESLLRNKNTDKRTRDFIAEKVQRAKSFINSIQQRESTLVRVMKAILEEQKEFFEKGPKYIKPLTLRDIARKLDLHESTISRVTSSKYVQTPSGVFRLKYFFSNQIKSTNREQYSSRSIKEMIKEIIEEYDGKLHLSDQKIADILAERGIKIARRTVAKYRKDLNILPSNLRR